MCNKVLFITALPLEFNSVKNFISNCQDKEFRGSNYEEGTYQQWQVAIVETGQGNSNAATETQKAINCYSPDYVFFVGIAGGIKDVKLGDVVAAEIVKGFERGKESDRGFLPRGEVGKSDYQLVQSAKSTKRNANWSKSHKTDIEPTAEVGVIVAGEKVVASDRSNTYKLITELYSDALAVEMEGIGFLTATHANNTKSIVIRGISDLLSNKEESDKAGWQKIAAHNATVFAFAMLDQLEKQNPSQLALLDTISNYLKKNLKFYVLFLVIVSLLLTVSLGFIQDNEIKNQLKNTINTTGSSSGFFKRYCSQNIIFWKIMAEYFNYSFAQYALGSCYLKVDMNYPQAFAWYYKAAEQNQPNAQNNLGWMYINEFGVPKNEKKANELQAIAWYKKAAEQNNPQA